MIHTGGMLPGGADAVAMLEYSQKTREVSKDLAGLSQEIEIFRAVAEGTEVEDRVEYAAPFAWLTEPLLVRRDLRRIFDHRSRAIVESCCGGRERGR